MTTQKGDSIWDDFRAQFALKPDMTFLDAMFIGTQPARVRDAVRRHLDGMAADPQGYAIQTDIVEGRTDHIAGMVAEYLGISDPETYGPRNVAITTSTTMGLGLIYDGLLMGDEQRVLTPACTPFFTSDALTLRQHSEFDINVLDVSDDTPVDDMARTPSRRRLDKVSLWDDLSDLDTKEMVDRTLSAITPETRVLGLTWVSSSTGLKLPVAEICHAVREWNRKHSRGKRYDVLTVVDAVHGFGVEDVSFKELGCDFLVTGCHKWLFGPLGTGFVCGRPDAWPWVVPTIPSTRGDHDPGHANSPGGIKSFASHWALKETLEVHRELGKGRIAARTHALARQLKEGLRDIAGVDVITPMSQDFSAGVVCCRIGGMKAGVAYKRLLDDFRVSASTSLPDLQNNKEVYLRFSPSVRNTEEEIERAVKAVTEIAAPRA